jgi:hypothetical protein
VNFHCDPLVYSDLSRDRSAERERTLVLVNTRAMNTRSSKRSSVLQEIIRTLARIAVENEENRGTS